MLFFDRTNIACLARECDHFGECHDIINNLFAKCCFTSHSGSRFPSIDINSNDIYDCQYLCMYVFHFCLFLCLPTEPRKEKTDTSSGGGGGGSALSPSGADQRDGDRHGTLSSAGAGSSSSSGGGANSSLNAGGQTPKLERPNTLGQPNKLSRRVICYHGEHCE